ncbi:hypothetical protein WICPIJ_008606, partial [Wickerhamomyces pijperi]
WWRYLWTRDEQIPSLTYSADSPWNTLTFNLVVLESLKSRPFFNSASRSCSSKNVDRVLMTMSWRSRSLVSKTESITPRMRSLIK